MSGGSITATGPERVKKHSGKVLLPSAALLLASTGTTFVTTGYFISSFRDIAAGAILLLMSILTIAVIRTAVSRLIFTGFIIAFSAASFISARSEILPNSIIDSYPTEGLIQDVSAKLNSYNITATIFPQGHENGGICALITYTGSCIPVNGERFSFSARIRKINNTNNSPAEIMLMRRGIFFRIYCSDRDIKFHPSDESAPVETFRNKLRLRLDSLFRADIASLLKGLFFRQYIDNSAENCTQVQNMRPDTSPGSERAARRNSRGPSSSASGFSRRREKSHPNWRFSGTYILRGYNRFTPISFQGIYYVLHPYRAGAFRTRRKSIQLPLSLRAGDSF